MVLKLLGDITKRIQKARLFTLNGDGATDASNKKQLVIMFHWVDKNLNVHEDFLLACMKLMLQMLISLQICIGCL